MALLFGSTFNSIGLMTKLNYLSRGIITLEIQFVKRCNSLLKKSKFVTRFATWCPVSGYDGQSFHLSVVNTKFCDMGGEGVAPTPGWNPCTLL